ncbi:helical backbone metal receptor [Flaviaesturariibacter amylovorans]|uniref:Helical backbone metal receptor n=1 Tax=Flaviaesturariibacter amylovorans TaxID=1084520 RepID=A0ABP8GNM6_9BACT
MRPLYDPFGRPLSLPHPPQRIVSLVPSQTELLYDLGLRDEVAGITKFCIHPDEWFRGKTRVGGTKTVHADRVAALQPDLVLANKEENVREQVEALAQDYATWVSDIETLDDALDMIRSIGALVHRAREAEIIARKIRGRFDRLEPVQGPKKRAGYLIWKDPYMSVGHDTFIHHMLGYLGVENAFADRGRYPEVSIEDLQGCDVILLSSEPYPFAEKHVEELLQAVPGAAVALVDGELFSWYGSRLLHTPPYFRNLRTAIAGID